MARRERSAGMLIFHRSRPGAVPTFLLLDYGRHWDFAKGHVHKGESDLDAAIRELAEETGIGRIEQIPDFSRQIIYFFRHPKRGLVRKEVIFFLARTKTRRVRLSDEHVGFAFLPFEQAIERVTYPNARQVLREAHEYLLTLESAASGPPASRTG